MWCWFGKQCLTLCWLSHSSVTRTQRCPMRVKKRAGISVLAPLMPFLIQLCDVPNFLRRCRCNIQSQHTRTRDNVLSVTVSVSKLLSVSLLSTVYGSRSLFYWYGNAMATLKLLRLSLFKFFFAFLLGFRFNFFNQKVYYFIFLLALLMMTTIMMHHACMIPSKKSK